MRNDRTLVLSASMDCSVALWDIYGNQIGIFGQVRSEHWTCNKSPLIASKLFHVPSFQIRCPFITLVMTFPCLLSEKIKKIVKKY